MKVSLFKLVKKDDGPIVTDWISLTELPEIPRKGELVAIYSWNNSSRCDWETITKSVISRTEYDVTPLRVVEVMYTVGKPSIENICVYLASDELCNEIVAKR